MSTDTRIRLVAAARASEIVSVVYLRGIQPGAVRDIAPITVTDQEVHARDVATGIDKTFRLAYLELEIDRRPRVRTMRRRLRFTHPPS